MASFSSQVGRCPLWHVSTRPNATRRPAALPLVSHSSSESFSSTPLPLPQTHDVRQQARCISTLGQEEGGEQLSMVEAAEACYLEALRACLLGGLTMEPLLLGLSDGYELCRWAGEEGCCAGVAALVVGACQAMPVHQKLIDQKLIDQMLLIRCC